MPKVSGKSLPVRTRWTPLWALALSTFTASIRAWGCGERRSFMCSMRGSTMSSAKRVAPVTLARPSTRRRGLPTMFITHPQRTFGDRFLDLLVAGAAAQISRDRFLDALARRARLARKQRLRRHQDARRAVAALRRAEVGKGRLQRIELGAAAETFDGVDRLAFALERKHQAGELGFAIDEHCAGAALAELAAVLGAGEAEVFAQHLEQRLVRRERSVVRLAVGRKWKVHPRHLFGPQTNCRYCTAAGRRPQRRQGSRL